MDNVAAGPAIGGVRMAVDVSLEECFRLARAMTLKNAAAGLAHGGGKAVIFADALRLVKECKEVSMTDTTGPGARPAARAHHAGGDGPAPVRRRRMSAQRK